MEAKVVFQTLSDNSRVYNVLICDGSEMVELNCSNEVTAHEVADTLNLFIKKFKIVSLG